MNRFRGELERFRLPNGLAVQLHRDDRLPLVAVNLWYHVGSKNERPGRTGLAHLFEHMLFQGSAHVDTNGHFGHLQRIGGVANGSTWYDRTNYYETVPAGQLELALWLESDRMGYLLEALDEAKLENQRSVVLNERRQRVDNQPYARPYEHLFELLVPGDHPYHWPVIGYGDDIAAATLDDVRTFFRTWYGPDNAVLTLAGAFDPARARDLVEAWFGSLGRTSGRPERRRWPLTPLDQAVVARVEDRVRLPRVYLAFRTPPFGEDAWFHGSLLGAVLSDGKSSPIYRELVWERQLAQEAGFFLYPTEEIGVGIAWATARPDVELERVTEALRGLLDGARDPIPPAELERGRKRLLAGLWDDLETLDERADRLSMYGTFFGRPELAWSEAERLEAITADGLNGFAERFLGRERSVQLEVVPTAEGAR